MEEKTAALIPVHNEAYLLPMCIESVLPLFDEVVLFDDASEDGSSCVIDMFTVRHPHVTGIISKEQVGWGEGRNRLMAATDARYLFWIDSDEIAVGGDCVERTVKSGLPAVRMGHTEMVGDFFHTTHRIYHNDPNQFFQDRKQVPELRWDITKTGFSTRRTEDPFPQCRPIGHFSFHCKGVKPDWKLAERLIARKWHVARKQGWPGWFHKWLEEDLGAKFLGDEATSFSYAMAIPEEKRHEMALGYINGTYDLAIPSYVPGMEKYRTRQDLPERPEAIMKSLPGRFTVVYDGDGKPVDRIDNLQKEGE